MFVIAGLFFYGGVFAQTPAPKPATTPTPAVAPAVPPGCVKASNGSHFICKDPKTGITSLQGYACTRGGHTVITPKCIVGGVFSMSDPEDVNCACCGECRFSRLLGLFVMVSKWILGLSGTAALLVFVYGGFFWIISGGDSARVERGKNALTGAVIGVIIVLTSWLVINFTLEALTGKGIDALQSEYGANKK